MHICTTARGGGNFYMWYIFNLVPQDILVTAPELQEDWVVQLLIMILKSTRRYSSTWCRRENPGHGTRIARGLVRYKG